MDDKALADKVVALGVGYHLEGGAGDGYFSLTKPVPTSLWLHPDRFVRNWRVAGALMEKCMGRETVAILTTVTSGPRDGQFGISFTRELGNDMHDPIGGAFGNSIPRTIIEACVKALEPE